MCLHGKRGNPQRWSPRPQQLPHRRQAIRRHGSTAGGRRDCARRPDHRSIPPLRPAREWLALSYVRAPAVADEVVHETWLAVIRGIHSFEERSSVKTWMPHPREHSETRAARESRTVPHSALPLGDADDGQPSVDPSRFFDQQHARWPGHWAIPPARRDELPEEHLSRRETLDSLKAAIEQLPTKQRRVIVLRDTSRGGRRTRSASCSTSARRTSACSCTAPARRCGRRSRTRSVDEPIGADLNESELSSPLHRLLPARCAELAIDALGVALDRVERDVLG
jgi:RNA polymerase sigma factor (sigma-70 family)